MVFLPVGNNRVPFALTTQLSLDSIRTRQSALSKVAFELSTGRRLNLPSDNPTEALRATILQRAKEQQLQYRENIKQGSAVLSFAEGVFSSFTDALDSARSIAIEVTDGTRSSADYQAARVEIDSLIDQLLTSANRKYLDSYVLAGSDSSKAPFQRDGNNIVFTGDSGELNSLQALDQSFPISMTADSAVGAFSTAGYGTNLSPNVNAATRLRDINQGRGIIPGSIEIDTGSGSPVTVDLSSANTIQDVINLVNNDATLSTAGFTIGINTAGNGLAVLTGPTANVTIREVAGGSMASDLGITLNNAAIPAQGSGLEPRVTLTTPLSLLNGGAGVNTSEPLIIENGPYSASIDLSGAITVEDVLNRINSAGVRVHAEINADQTGINVLNRLSGASYTIIENSQTGQVAQGLGILTTRLDTLLADFNDQAGVNRREGNDIEITVADGSVYQIDLGAAATVGDVKQIIESTTAGEVTVSINPQGGLLLDDTTTGAGAFAVRDIDGSGTASSLGIAGSTTGGGSILGSNAHRARVKGVFDTLLRLRNGLVNRDSGEVGVATQQITRDQERVLGAAGGLGAQLRTMETLDNRMASDLEQLTLDTTRLVDADLTETLTKLAQEQTALQAALASGARLLQGSLLDYL